VASADPKTKRYQLCLCCAVLCCAVCPPQALRNTVTVPRHWSQKRKYLQGKRGIEKPAFKLPDFIEATGAGYICEVLIVGVKMVGRVAIARGCKASVAAAMWHFQLCKLSDPIEALNAAMQVTLHLLGATCTAAWVASNHLLVDICSGWQVGWGSNKASVAVTGCTALYALLMSALNSSSGQGWRAVESCIQQFPGC
jgi:hypothetical protein